MFTKTALDGPSLSPEQLLVRGRDLNELVGRLSYVGAVYHLLANREPTEEQERALDAFLVASLFALTPASPMVQLATLAGRYGATTANAFIAGLMGEDRAARPRVFAAEHLAASGLDRDCREGLFFFGLAPLLLAYIVESKGGRTGETLAQRLEVGQVSGAAYLPAIFFLVTGRQPAPTEQRAFDAVMTAFHAGFGGVTPTVSLPRGAASTRSAVATCIAAGYTAAGPAHVGACEQAMRLFQQIEHAQPGDPVAQTQQVLHQMLAQDQLVPGFGHPLFKRDPRPDHLRQLLAELGQQSPFLEIYDTAVALLQEYLGIAPNIDSISAAVFLSLGIAPDYGTGLFLCSRTAAMVAHILEVQRMPPFGARSEQARQWLGASAKDRSDEE